MRDILFDGMTEVRLALKKLSRSQSRREGCEKRRYFVFLCEVVWEG